MTESTAHPIAIAWFGSLAWTLTPDAPNAAALEQPGARQDSHSTIELQIQALPAQYPLGYPVAIRLMARNAGDAAVPIKGRLSPSGGQVRIAHRRVDATEWSAFEPLAWFEPIQDEAALLQPGEQTELTMPIHFGSAGWTFPDPGEYAVHARLQSGSDGFELVSDAITIRIGQPLDSDDKSALRPLIDAQGQLDQVVGRALAFGGEIPKAIWESLERTVDRYEHTALGGALQLDIIARHLRVPVDTSDERPRMKVNEARELLANVCTDSGVSALKSQLLQREADSMQEESINLAETGAAAWDGTTSNAGDTMATYSDQSLQAWGPSLHFCRDEAHLRDSVTRSIAGLAVQLRGLTPLRIVVVGHGDAAGSCRYNDDLGLRRARTVRRALLEAGVPAHVEVASLGERRPLDFASTSGAHDLNRRAEILIRTKDQAPKVVLPRLAPDCPPVGK